MTSTLLLLAILPLAFCVDETLPTAADVIKEAKEITCEAFIEGKPNTWCQPDPPAAGDLPRNTYFL